MPKLAKNQQPAATMAQMREWRQQYGQSVRQQSVRNMSTKDRPGTLPVNAYEDETVNTEMFDFSVLQRVTFPCSSGQDNIEISQRSRDACMVAKKENLRQSNTVSHLRDWQVTMSIFFRAIPRGHPGE